MQHRVYFFYLLAFLLFSTVILFQISSQYQNKSVMETAQYWYATMKNNSIYGLFELGNNENRTSFTIVTASTSRVTKTTTPPKSKTTTKVNTTNKAGIATKSKPKGKTTKKPKAYTTFPSLKTYNGSYPNVTVVTAYFNIGKFKKGGGSATFDTDLYEKWTQTYRNMKNPLIFYTDCEQFKNMFTKVRSMHLNTTRIIHINRTDIWSFRYLDRIKKIYSIKGYPKHHPNTVVPEYSCIQHSKHAVIEDAILKNYVTTKYVTWLDIGYFRHMQSRSPDKRNRSYWIVKPDNFNESRIALNQISKPDMSRKPESIFKRNIVWIGGGMAFGTPKVYLDFVQDYKHAVERYLNMSLMNTDQQVIYSMNLPEEKKILKPKVDLQIYKPDGKFPLWFYLGFSCYREEV